MDEFNKPACPTEVDRMKGYLTTAAAHRISSYSKSTTDSPLTTNGSFRAGSWESVSLIYDPVAHSEMPNMAVFKETTILSCRCRCRHTNPPSELNWAGGHCCYLIDMKFFFLYAPIKALWWMTSPREGAPLMLSVSITLSVYKFALPLAVIITSKRNVTDLSADCCVHTFSLL